MNWTGGLLHRHVKGRSSELLRIQREPFSKTGDGYRSIFVDDLSPQAIFQPPDDGSAGDVGQAVNPIHQHSASPRLNKMPGSVKHIKGQRRLSHNGKRDRELPNSISEHTRKVGWDSTTNKLSIINPKARLLKKSDWAGLDLSQPAQSFSCRTMHRVGMARQRRQRRVKDQIPISNYRQSLSMDKMFPDNRRRRFCPKPISIGGETKYTARARSSARNLQSLNSQARESQGRIACHWDCQDVDLRPSTREVLDSLVPLDMARELDTFDCVKAVQLSNLQRRKSQKKIKSTPSYDNPFLLTDDPSSRGLPDSSDAIRISSWTKTGVVDEQRSGSITQDGGSWSLVLDPIAKNMARQQDNTCHFSDSGDFNGFTSPLPDSIGLISLLASSSYPQESIMGQSAYQSNNTAQRIQQEDKGKVRWLSSDSLRRQGNNNSINGLESSPRSLGVSSSQLHSPRPSAQRCCADNEASGTITSHDADQLLRDEWPHIYTEMLNTFTRNTSDDFCDTLNDYTVETSLQPHVSINLASSPLPRSMTLQTPVLTKSSVNGKCFVGHEDADFGRDFKLAPGPRYS